MEPAHQPHPLGVLVREAAAGRFPPDDGGVSVVRPVRPHVETVVAFTGHAVVATSRERAAVLARRPDGFGGAVSPAFLLWLGGDDGVVGSHDVLLVACGQGGGTLSRRYDLDDHPRVRHARTLRDDVRVHGDERGLVTLGIGLGGILELSVELLAQPHGSGVGRALVRDALGLVADGELVVAEVAPGNARSLRAFLSAGFVPIGSSVHVTRR